VLVVERCDLQLDLLAADLEACSVDLVDGHLHAVEHVLAVQRRAAGQRAGIADLDDVLRKRWRASNAFCDVVARSKGMSFVRNGRAHSPDDAAKFLREKLKAMGSDVRTAEDFIDKVATKSSTSGKPYTVRYEDGREVTSAEFLRNELARQDRR
jgi:hypothetical protein